MPPYHISNTSRALFSVFVAPTLTPRTAFLPKTAIRTKTFKKGPPRQAITDTYTVDNAITAEYVNLIDADGTFQRNFPRDKISYNRVQNHLLLVDAGKKDALGNQDPSALPTCKIISKMDLRAQQEKKLGIERRKAKGQSAGGPSTKNLELNWAIAGGDLKHRLEKLRKFMEEGRKVEVLLAPKKRGRKATPEECKSVLSSVRAAVAEQKGARETKDAEGTVGGILKLVFEGKKIETDEKEKAI